MLTLDLQHGLRPTHECETYSLISKVIIKFRLAWTFHQVRFNTQSHLSIESWTPWQWHILSTVNTSPQTWLVPKTWRWANITSCFIVKPYQILKTATDHHEMADTLCHDDQEIAMITYQFAWATSALRSRAHHPTAEHYVCLTAWESHKSWSWGLVKCGNGRLRIWSLWWWRWVRRRWMLLILAS